MSAIAATASSRPHHQHGDFQSSQFWLRSPARSPAMISLAARDLARQDRLHQALARGWSGEFLQRLAVHLGAAAVYLQAPDATRALYCAGRPAAERALSSPPSSALSPRPTP